MTIPKPGTSLFNSAAIVLGVMITAGGWGMTWQKQVSASENSSTRIAAIELRLDREFEMMDAKVSRFADAIGPVREQQAATIASLDALRLQITDLSRKLDTLNDRLIEPR